MLSAGWTRESLAAWAEPVVEVLRENGRPGDGLETLLR
jgi:hypothetical protein